MQPAGNRNAIPIIGGGDCRPVVRHRHDRIRWRNLALDWIGGGGVGNADLGIRFRIGRCPQRRYWLQSAFEVCRAFAPSGAIAASTRQSRHLLRQTAPGPAEANSAPIRPIAVATPDFVLDMRTSPFTLDLHSAVWREGPAFPIAARARGAIGKTPAMAPTLACRDRRRCWHQSIPTGQCGHSQPPAAPRELVDVVSKPQARPIARV